jgi:hypothetical protein
LPHIGIMARSVRRLRTRHEIPGRAVTTPFDNWKSV